MARKQITEADDFYMAFDCPTTETGHHCVPPTRQIQNHRDHIVVVFDCPVNGCGERHTIHMEKMGDGNAA